jgi:hypothetical protein
MHFNGRMQWVARVPTHWLRWPRQPHARPPCDHCMCSPRLIHAKHQRCCVAFQLRTGCCRPSKRRARAGTGRATDYEKRDQSGAGLGGWSSLNAECRRFWADLLKSEQQGPSPDSGLTPMTQLALHCCPPNERSHEGDCSCNRFFGARKRSTDEYVRQHSRG